MKHGNFVLVAFLVKFKLCKQLDYTASNKPSEILITLNLHMQKGAAIATPLSLNANIQK
jgi:hypothetical protein